MDIQHGFRALADPTRREILMHLTSREMTIAEVADQFDITRSAVRKHLTILEQGALISVHAQGRERVNRLEPGGLKSVSDWINTFSRFWDERLDNLQSAVARAGTNQTDTESTQGEEHG